MKKKWLFLSTCLLMLISSSFSAIAVTSTAKSTIYFDQNDNIIGQSLIDCRSYTAYAGQNNQANPNKIIETWGCDRGIVVCTGTTPSCFIAGADTSYNVIFHSATGRTYQDYCNALTDHITPGMPFSGHPDCSIAATQGPGYINDFIPYTYGIPPS